MKSKIETVVLKNLKVNLFVRKGLDQDHILYLAELMQNGVEMRDKILVGRLNGVDHVADGRHRLEAYELNDITEAKAEIIEVADEVELISLAYKANDPQGSLRPSRADTEHTIMLLLEREVSQKRVADLLGLPSAIARRYVAEVKSRTSRAKLQRAASAITDGGLTLMKAAEQYEVDEGKLKELISGRRRKHKQGIAEFQRALTKAFRSISQKNAALLRSLLDKYEDADVTEKQVSGIFDHVEDLQKKSARAVADWRKRFNAMNGKTAKSA